MVGKKVRDQPHPVRLCKHSHAERVAESVGAMVDEKKREDRKLTGRGVRNIAIELWVLAALPFVSIEVEINGGSGERGRDAREYYRNDRRRGPVTAVEKEERLRETRWD